MKILFGSVNVKFEKKNCILKCKKFFCSKLPNSSRKPIKKFLHFKLLTLQNVKFEMSELGVVKRCEIGDDPLQSVIKRKAII